MSSAFAQCTYSSMLTPRLNETGASSKYTISADCFLQFLFAINGENKKKRKYSKELNDSIIVKVQSASHNNMQVMMMTSLNDRVKRNGKRYFLQCCHGQLPQLMSNSIHYSVA